MSLASDYLSLLSQQCQDSHSVPSAHVLTKTLRSTSFMHVVSRLTTVPTSGMYGITSPLALAAWQQGTEALGDSDLILEGGDE